jgi:phosphoglycolate phosphatase-like HAD superfamily hydrolase
MTIPIHQSGFDFDGVIADIGEAFIRMAIEEYGCSPFRLEDITSFQIEKCLPVSPEIAAKIFTDITKDSLATGLQPIAGAIDGLNTLSSLGPITIITARPLAQPVCDWLDHYLPAAATQRIQVISTGDHDDKMRYLKQYRINHFVDDRAETCSHLHAHDIAAYVFRQPWNEGHHNLPDIGSWQELLHLFIADPNQPEP